MNITLALLGVDATDMLRNVAEKVATVHNLSYVARLLEEGARRDIAVVLEHCFKPDPSCTLYPITMATRSSSAFRSGSLAAGILALEKVSTKQRVFLSYFYLEVRLYTAALGTRMISVLQ